MADLTTIARPYAKAVFEQARDSDSLEPWSERLALLVMITEDPQMTGFLDNPDVEIIQHVTNRSVDLIEEGVAVFSKMGNAPMIKIANVRGAADSATDRQVQTEEIDEQVVTDTAQVWSSQAKTLAELTRITSRTAMASGAHLPENAAKDVQAATAETLRDLAAAQRRSGDVSQAERNLKAAIQMEPDNSVGLLELGHPASSRHSIAMLPLASRCRFLSVPDNIGPDHALGCHRFALFKAGPEGGFAQFAHQAIGAPLVDLVFINTVEVDDATAFIDTEF